VLSGPDWHESEAPQPLGSVNESDYKNMLIGQLVDEAIRFQEQLSDRFVSKFWNGLPTVCEINEGSSSRMGFLYESRSVEL